MITTNMPNQHHIVLRQHALHHLPELCVNENVFRQRFIAGCSVANCNADCCKGGVWVDRNERETILTYAERIQRHMESSQEHNPARWFEDNELLDSDFPSGQAIGTQVRDSGCVFLKSDGKCVLQTAAVAEGLEEFSLKPFFCVAFPITIEDGTLMVDDPDLTNRQLCCSMVQHGTLTAIEVYSNELKSVLGNDGLNELIEHVDGMKDMK
jgi:hypothetical protein